MLPHFVSLLLSVGYAGVVRCAVYFVISSPDFRLDEIFANLEQADKPCSRSYSHDSLLQ